MKKTLLVLVASLMVLGFGCSKKDTSGNNQTPVVTSTPETTTTTVATTTVKKPAPKPAAKKPADATTPQKVLEYNEALKIYGTNNYRLQIVSCSARPGAMIVKKGMKFMIDNRDDVARTIMIGSTKYSLGAYGWTVTSLGQAGSYNITCNGGGAGSITVEP